MKAMFNDNRLNKINHHHDSGQPLDCIIASEDSQTEDCGEGLAIGYNCLGGPKRGIERGDILMIARVTKNRNNSKSRLSFNQQQASDRKSKKMRRESNQEGLNKHSAVLASSKSSPSSLSPLTSSSSHRLINVTTRPMMNIRHSSRSSNAFKFAFVGALILLAVCCLSSKGVYSLNCYVCSSVDNPGCDESFQGKANQTEVDCTKHLGDKPAKVCRKIVQYIESKKVVIRSCGYIDDHEDKKPMCYKRSGTFAIMMESCNCYTDACNDSASLVPKQSVATVLAIFSTLLYISLSFYVL